MIALHGGFIVAEPGAAPEAATVLVDGATIVAIEADGRIPADAQRIDCSGCTILSGFWNSHVHFFERKWMHAGDIPRDELDAQLQDFLRFGFTTVFDLSSEFNNTSLIRERIKSGEVRGPRIFTTGAGIVPAGFSFPDVAYALLGQMKVSLPQASEPVEARAIVSSLLDRRVDAVKLFSSAPSGMMLSTETMRAAVDAAHEAGIRVFVHPNTEDDVRRAVHAGADVIAHTIPGSGPWSELLLDTMAAADVALIPTLTLWQHFTKHDRISLQQQQRTSAAAQLRAWNARGGAVLFGTDLGAVDPYPGTEYILMHEAGMSFSDILASLTTVPAQRFCAGERLGKVSIGFQADLVVVRGDPSRDISTLTDVRYVFRGGVLTT